MGNITYVNFVAGKRNNCDTFGNLLPARVDPETVGKWEVRLLDPIAAIYGRSIGYSDFTEMDSGYISVYIPEVGYADIYKAYVVMND